MKRSKRIGLIKNIACKISLLIVLFILLLATSSSAWFLSTFGEMDFSIVVYQLFSPMEGTSAGILNEYVESCLYPSIARTLLLFALYVFWDVVMRKVHVNVYLRLLKREWKINLTPKRAQIVKYMSVVLGVVLMTVSVCSYAIKMGVPQYLKEITNDSTLFEEYYIDPNQVAMEFPQNKRNLLLIYMESMEATYASVDKGGAKEINYIPELIQLAEENYNFSDNGKVGGAHYYAGGWTMAGLLASSSGVPYKLPIEGNSSGEYETFLPGLTTLGEILEEEGYKNYFMCGSDAAFGGREAFYTQHGNYEILDYDKAIENGIIDKDYYEYWGMEDEKLYEFAKEQLTDIAQAGEPFNFTMLTVDTHHPVGYECNLCQNQYGDQFANAISCASRQVYDFVMWCKEQVWYEDTTIVITGDHLSMNNTFWDDIGNYERNIFNCFIHVTDENILHGQLKNREFSTIDLFPTVLASLGVKIEGDRLGLGTNLFSDKETLPEILGKEQFVEGLSLYSNYYFTNFVVK